MRRRFGEREREEEEEEKEKVFFPFPFRHVAVTFQAEDSQKHLQLRCVSAFTGLSRTREVFTSACEVHRQCSCWQNRNCNRRKWWRGRRGWVTDVFLLRSREEEEELELGLESGHLGFSGGGACRMRFRAPPPGTRTDRDAKHELHTKPRLLLHARLHHAERCTRQASSTRFQRVQRNGNFSQ